MEKEHLPKEYSVSETVRLVGVESHVLRYWEEELELLIHRNALGHRIYGSRDIELLCRVKEWKEKGLQLKAIRVLLKQTGAAGQNAGMADRRKTEADGTPEETYAYEIIPAVRQKPQENLDRLAAVFRQIIEETAAEQTEKLERQIELQMREGIQELYLQYFQMLKEAAVSETPEKDTEKKTGKLKQIIKILFE